MDIEVTDRALEVLRRSMELGRFDTDLGGIRLRGARSLSGGFNVQTEFVDSAPPGDTVVELEGLNLFVDPALFSAIQDPVVTVAPEHDHIIVMSRSDAV